MIAAMLLSGGVLVGSSGPAVAATQLHATYKVTGSTFLKAPNFTLTLGPLDGGKLAGGYTIPQFQDCGLATLLINLTIPGSGNTITLTLGKAKLG